MFGSQAATQLTYTQLRALQISLVFSFTILLQCVWVYPKAPVTAYVLLLIYAGFDNGTTLQRTYYRYLGTVYGIFLGFFFWYIGHIDYRLILLVCPITIYLAYFFSSHAYHIPTVFTVCTALLGMGYYGTYLHEDIKYLLVDFFMCSLIAFVMILFFEYFIFRRYQHMRRFIIESQTATITHLLNLVDYLNQPKVTRKEWFDECAKLIANLANTEKLLGNAHFMKRSMEEFGEEFNDFIDQVNQLYSHFKALYFALHLEPNAAIDVTQFIHTINHELLRLKHLVSSDLAANLWGKQSYVTYR